jgi:hypothetical protein
MTSSKCKDAYIYNKQYIIDADDHELDCIEPLKFWCMFLCQINATAFYLMTSSIWNPWKILDFF